MEFSVQDDDFGGDYSAANATRVSGLTLMDPQIECFFGRFGSGIILKCIRILSGSKRSFGDIEDDEDDIFGSKKVPFCDHYNIENFLDSIILSSVFCSPP